jgi:urease accessory protein
LTDVVRVVARAGPRGTTVPELRGIIPWRPQPVRGNPGVATVVLVQTAACLLAGDDVRLEVEVGVGAQLTLRELGATIVHHGRGGPPARLAVRVRLETGATLRWAAAPLISSAGSAVRRTLHIDAGPEAVALVRDTLVLGRAGEGGGGVVDSHLRAEHDGRALLDERLETGDGALLSSPAMLGRARVLDAVMLLGRRADAPAEGTLELAGPGAVWRSMGPPEEPGMNKGDTVWNQWERSIDSIDQSLYQLS